MVVSKLIYKVRHYPAHYYAGQQLAESHAMEQDPWIRTRCGLRATIEWIEIELHGVRQPDRPVLRNERGEDRDFEMVWRGSRSGRRLYRMCALRALREKSTILQPFASTPELKPQPCRRSILGESALALFSTWLPPRPRPGQRGRRSHVNITQQPPLNMSLRGSRGWCSL